MRSVAAVALAAALSIAVAGCGSSEDDSSSKTSDGTIRLLVDTNTSPGAAIGNIAFPQPYDAAKAAAEAINAKGGVNGHEIVVDVCDNKADPNQSAACGRKAATGEYIAVIGAWDVIGAGQILPILEAEGIPYLGPLAANPAEFQNKMSFPFAPGVVVTNFGVGTAWADHGCKSVVYISPANQGAAADAASKGLEQLAKAAGIQFESVEVTIGQPDVSAVVSTALAAKPNCVSYLADGQTFVKLLGELRGSGYTGKVITTNTTLLPGILGSVGDLANDVIVLAGGLLPDSDDPMSKQFAQEVAATVPEKDVPATLSDFGAVGWSSVQLIKQIFQDASDEDLTSDYILKKLPTMCDVNVGNYYPHVNFCEPVESSLFPRVFNAQVRYLKVDGGRFVDLDDEWHDISNAVPR